LEATKEDGLISISTEAFQDRIIVKIKDNGIGIHSGFLDRIFDPFFSTKNGGTGLGLTYVKQIINEHEGEVQVDSKSGNGTTFILSLPKS